MKKSYIPVFITAIFLVTFLLSGCEGVNAPPLPDGGANGENAEAAYIKISPASANIKVNQSKQFSVNAYDSNNNPIAMNIYEIEWFVEFECPGCGVVWKIGPTSNSLQTTFTPLKTGKYKRYKVCAMYQGKLACAIAEAQ